MEKGTNFHQHGPVFYLTTIVLAVLVSGDNNQVDYLVFQDPTSCSQHLNQTFSLVNLGCINCLKDKDKNKGFISSCSCPLNHILVYHNDPQIFASTKCVQCPPENAVSYDQEKCLTCFNKTTPDEFTGKCPSCPVGSILVYKDLNGETKSAAECIQCSDGFTPSGEECIRCHPSFPNPTKGLCECPDSTHNLINGICFAKELVDSQIEKSSMFKVEYDSGHRVDSPFFKENLLSSYYLCKGQRNVTACQLLANMCTLLLHSYSNEHPNACGLYRSAVSEPFHHPPPYIPKLYYLNIEAPSLLIRANLIPFQFDMNLEETSSDVNITVARSSIDGTFLGLSLLSDIIPCAEPARVKRIAQKFGSTYKTSCTIPVQDLWNRYAKMEFLDSFLSVHEGAELKLYPVPVKILNFRQQGVKNNEMDDSHQWQLVRRFFMVDTIDSIDSVGRTEGKYKSTKLVRFLEKVHIGIQLQNSPDPGKIYVPLITLSYKEMDVDSFRRNVPAHFDFTVEYFMDMSRSIEDVKISVSVISSLTVLWAAMQAWSWNRRSGRPYIDITTIANLLMYSCGHLADAFFIVCFGSSLFWFFFYKKQAAVHILLPQPEQEKLIRDLLIAAFSLKIVEVIRMIACQVDIDIFFIDWERPKTSTSPSLSSAVTTKPGSGSTTKISDTATTAPAGNMNNPEKSENNNVSIWRTYFIANEWNEIQSSRKIHMACQILITIFFLEIVGLKYLGLSWPSGSLSPGLEHRNIPYSTSARFAIGSFVYLLIGIIQWLFRVVIFERFIANKIQDFVDVCTLANISVFILAANQYGYYIHGRSVHGFSDTCMQTMVEQLNREEEDLCGRRGLLPSTDQQTFLISVPSSFRSVYNQVLQPLYATTNANVNVVKGRIQLGGVTSKFQSSNKQTSAMLNLSVHAYHSMNRFLTAFLEHALSDLDYDVTEKSFFESTFDMEFGDITNDRAIFYTDNGHSFDSILFYGNERTLFLFNLYTFIFVEILSHNFLLAGIITYLTDMVVKHVRNYLGKRNLGRKTLIQERFLI